MDIFWGKIRSLFITTVSDELVYLYLFPEQIYKTKNIRISN